MERADADDGLVGQYLARVYDEVRRWPLYLVREARGFTTWAGFGPPDYRADGLKRSAPPGESGSPLAMQ